MELVEGIKSIIYNQVKDENIKMSGDAFSECQKTYFWTNENISGTLNLVDTKGKDDALCVLASGDHAFNLITNGVLNITTFDTNKFTEYLALGLKKSLILKYTYWEYFLVIERITNPNISIDELTSILIELLPFMEPSHRSFWQQIINYNYKLQNSFNTNLNLIYLLCIGINCPTDFSLNNNYLTSEEEYNKLRSNLNKASIQFRWVNALDLANEFKGMEYDIIMLSNILDYFTDYWGNNWDLEKLNEYIDRLSQICKDDSLLFIKYIMMYRARKNFRNHIFEGSSIIISELDTIHEIPRYGKYDNVKDGVVLKRVIK